MSLKTEEIKKIYGGYSGAYDFIFKGFFFPRIKHAIETMHIRPGDRILDVGVGTGLSLPLFPDYCSVTGIDLSPDMLQEAKKKVEMRGLKHITLMEMDAQNLAFEDDTFDHVISTHVISVVPDPVRVIAEMKRVCKKGGNIVLVNHFQSPNKLLAKFDELISPITKKVGWRTDLSLDGLIMDTKLDVRSMYKMSKIDLWTVVWAVNNKDNGVGHS
jgi:phosphatidylethanolamine/phosphatidyl-N-methylethanolamine N-methyltransferase